MCHTDDLLIALNCKIERLIGLMFTKENSQVLKEIKLLLKEANDLKRFELETKYPEQFRNFKLKK